MLTLKKIIIVIDYIEHENDKTKYETHVSITGSWTFGEVVDLLEEMKNDLIRKAQEEEEE